MREGGDYNKSCVVHRSQSSQMPLKTDGLIFHFLIIEMVWCCIRFGLESCKIPNILQKMFWTWMVTSKPRRAVRFQDSSRHLSGKLTIYQQAPKNIARPSQLEIPDPFTPKSTIPMIRNFYFDAKKDFPETTKENVGMMGEGKAKGQSGEIVRGMCLKISRWFAYNCS